MPGADDCIIHQPLPASEVTHVRLGRTEDRQVERICILELKSLKLASSHGGRHARGRQQLLPREDATESGIVWSRPRDARPQRHRRRRNRRFGHLGHGRSVGLCFVRHLLCVCRAFEIVNFLKLVYTYPCTDIRKRVRGGFYSG